MQEITPIPTKTLGPLIFHTKTHSDFDAHVPLATYEKPLWPSVSRGMRVCNQAGGIYTHVFLNTMTRSVILEASSIADLTRVDLSIGELSQVVEQTSKFCRLKDYHTQIVGNLLYLRFSFTTGEASGHNMTTKAADELIHFILEKYSFLTYVSISGNYCADKKVSAVNGILGRGKYTIAEIVIPHKICTTLLRITPQKIVDLNIKKNLIGSILSGGVRSANAHYANMLLAVFLATGQDGANIIEGSQGITHTQMRGEDLYFSVTLPNLIVGTVGSGKENSVAYKNLELMGCLNIENGSEKLAMIIAGVVLCGELSLLSAQTNPGELVKSHLKLERCKR